MTTDKDSKAAEVQDGDLDAVQGGIRVEPVPSTPGFLPEVEDEVIVGFLNDDPRDPIIQGMVHSSVKAVPIKSGK